MEEKEVKKPTYEELEAKVAKYENDIRAYSGLNSQLYQQLMSANLTNFYKRLDYLFEVVKYSDSKFSGDFVVSCIDEIKNMLTTPEEPEKK